MKTLTMMEMAEAYLKTAKVWGVYLSNSNTDVEDEEVSKAVPLLGNLEVLELTCQGTLFVEFETRELAETFFWTVVGDDGPTKTNSYDGPARVFAVWGGPEGLLSENT